MRLNNNFDKIEFNEVKEQLKNFLRQTENASKVKDLDFEASNIQIPLDIASYMIHYLLLYLNITVSELFLEYTQTEANAITIAKSLGYRPKRRKSSRGVIEFSIKNDSEILINQNNSLNIPIYTKLLSTRGIKFLTLENGVVQYDSDTETVINPKIRVMQGELIRQEINFSNNVSTFTLENSADVIEDGFLKVFVGGTTIENSTEYTDAFTMDTEITEDSPVFYIERIENQLRIKFGEGGFGRIPRNTVGFIYYVKSDGLSGNNITGNLTLEENNSVYTTLGEDVTNDDVNINITTAFTGGTNTESLESIKANAPKFFSSRNRGVTESDLQAILGNLGYMMNAWGGEKEFKLKMDSEDIKNDLDTKVYPMNIIKVENDIDLGIDGFSPQNYDINKTYEYEDFIQDVYTQNILFLKDNTPPVNAPNNDYDGLGGYLHWLETHEPYIGNLIVSGYKLDGSVEDDDEGFMRLSPYDITNIRRDLENYKVLSLKIRPITPIIISYLISVNCRRSDLFIGNGKAVIDNVKSAIREYFNQNFSGWNAEAIKSQLIDRIMDFQEVKYAIIDITNKIFFFNPYFVNKIITIRLWNGIEEGSIKIPVNGYSEEFINRKIIRGKSGSNILEYVDETETAYDVENSYVNYEKGIIEFALTSDIVGKGINVNDVITFKENEEDMSGNDRYSMILTFSNQEIQEFKKEIYVKSIKDSEIDLRFN